MQRSCSFQGRVAANDRGRVWGSGRLGDGCLETLPHAIEHAPGAETVRLIDVLWIDISDGRVVGAFEVEHTTSIHSGIVRLLDLALGDCGHASQGLYLVAPDDREDEVRVQLRRPAFSRVADMQVRFLPYSELEKHRHAMARFGSGLKAIQAVARSLP